MPTDAAESRTAHLERWLLSEFGPVLSGSRLYRLLGHPTGNAFRQSLRRHGAPVPLFQMTGKKGWCATARDLSHWIAQLETAADGGKIVDQEDA